MSTPLHVVVPAAHVDDPGFTAALQGLALPNLSALLARMAVVEEAGTGETDSLSLPFEQVVARANGLPAEPGRTPWAAFETGTVGTPCAWVKPCRWAVGAHNVTMDAPAALRLDEAASDALLAAMAPWFVEDGITLQRRPGMADAWLATGEVFRDLPTASLDRVVGREIEPWLPPSRVLRRLQNEMQMLLYTHPVTEAREAAGLPTVNSFWVTGAGQLDAAVPPAAGLRIEPALDAAARTGDVAAWAAAWQQLDATQAKAWRDATGAHPGFALTLCGERWARTWRAAASGGGWQRFKNIFGVKSASEFISLL